MYSIKFALPRLVSLNTSRQPPQTNALIPIEIHETEAFRLAWQIVFISRLILEKKKIRKNILNDIFTQRKIYFRKKNY